MFGYFLLQRLDFQLQRLQRRRCLSLRLPSGPAAHLITPTTCCHILYMIRHLWLTTSFRFFHDSFGTFVSYRCHVVRRRQTPLSISGFFPDLEAHDQVEFIEFGLSGLNLTSIGHDRTPSLQVTRTSPPAAARRPLRLFDSDSSDSVDSDSDSVDSSTLPDRLESGPGIAVESPSRAALPDCPDCRTAGQQLRRNCGAAGNCGPNCGAID